MYGGRNPGTSQKEHPFQGENASQHGWPPSTPLILLLRNLPQFHLSPLFWCNLVWISFFPFKFSIEFSEILVGFPPAFSSWPMPWAWTTVHSVNIWSVTMSYSSRVYLILLFSRLIGCITVCAGQASLINLALGFNIAQDGEPPISACTLSPPFTPVPPSTPAPIQSTPSNPVPEIWWRVLTTGPSGSPFQHPGNRRKNIL